MRRAAGSGAIPVVAAGGFADLGEIFGQRMRHEWHFTRRCGSRSRHSWARQSRVALAEEGERVLVGATPDQFGDLAHFPALTGMTPNTRHWRATSGWFATARRWLHSGCRSHAAGELSFAVVADTVQPQRIEPSVWSSANLCGWRRALLQPHTPKVGYWLQTTVRVHR